MTWPTASWPASGSPFEFEIDAGRQALDLAAARLCGAKFARPSMKDPAERSTARLGDLLVGQRRKRIRVGHCGLGHVQLGAATTSGSEDVAVSVGIRDGNHRVACRSGAGRSNRRCGERSTDQQRRTKRSQGSNAYSCGEPAQIRRVLLCEYFRSRPAVIPRLAWHSRKIGPRRMPPALVVETRFPRRPAARVNPRRSFQRQTVPACGISSSISPLSLRRIVSDARRNAAISSGTCRIGRARRAASA